MKGSELPVRESAIGRRDFFRVGAGAAAAVSILNGVKASAQAPSSQGIPWWAARPGKARRSRNGRGQFALDPAPAWRRKFQRGMIGRGVP